MTADERGMVSLWMLGLSLLLLTLGGVSVDLWRAVAQRQSLASVAEAAALAGASGIDVEAFRSAGAAAGGGDVLRLDETAAATLVAHSLAANADTPGLVAHQVAVDPSAVTVTVEGEIHLTLLRLLPLGEDRLPVRVSATARPRLVD